MWDSINTKRNGELISLDMIFMDEKETLIHATVRKNQVNRYRHLLIEGSLFVIKNFKVIEASGEYRPLTSNLKINFLLTTSIKKLQEGSVNIPINGFEFVKADMLDARVNNNRILSDVVGCLCGIGDMESAGAKWKKRDIQVVTDYMVKSKITLWEDFGEKFDPYLYSKDSGPYIVIITSCTVKEFRGEVCFATTSASKIYVNLGIDYITSLTPKFTTSVGLQTLESSNSKSIPPEEEMFLNRMDIKELLDCDWSPEIQEYILTVRAKITEIDNFFGWNYISCNKCPKKVKPSNGVYICDNCAKECEFPLVKYKIVLKVTDDSEEKTTFVLFNPIAEKLLDTSAHKLLNRLSASSNEVPREILSLCQKEFVFKLKLNSYNLIEGVEDFTVSKVFIPDENLETQYKATKDKKAKSMLEVEENTDSRKQNPKRRISSKESKTDEKPVDVSFDNLEDAEVVEHAQDGVKSRKRRNVIIDDEDVSENDKK